jgi:hypothetical protein
MTLTPAMTVALTEVAAQAAAAGHGNKEPIYQAAVASLGISRATLLRMIKQVAITKPRKQRSDANQCILTRDEALLISMKLVEATRKNNKRTMCIFDAVETLRTNGLISAQRVNPETGEVFQLSENAIARALRAYKLHPDQLMQPNPVTALASPHPNYVWCLDASVSIMYYLEKVDGLQVMDRAKFYKNKPANLKKIEHDMVWRYAVTDHTSGWIFVNYVPGAESGIHLCNTFIAAIQKRGLDDPVHGVPRIVMLDPGSANTGALFKNLCAGLCVDVQINEVGNPRAKGQVENANNLIECKYESKLKFVQKKVTNINEMNELATRWMVHFNATRIHTRHGKTRYNAWLEITPDQLRIAPPVAVCRELITSAPESRVVTPHLEVSFGGRLYDVSDVPHAIVGDKLMVCRNAYRDDAINVVTINDDGRTVFFVAPIVNTDANGFRVGAPIICQEYKSHKHTDAQTAKNEIELLAMDATTLAEAALKRKAKVQVFGGKIDPFKSQNDAPKQTFLPRAGVANTIVAPVVEIKPLTHTKAALILARAGIDITDQVRQRIKDWYPVGVPETEIDSLAHRLTLPQTTKLFAVS